MSFGDRPSLYLGRFQRSRGQRDQSLTAYSRSKEYEWYGNGNENDLIDPLAF